MKEKPKHLKTLKIIGFFGVAVGIFGFILAISGFGDFNTNNFMIGGFLGTFGMFIGLSCLMIGFRPEMSKLGIKSAKYIQEDNKNDLKDMANTTADITSEAITKVAQSIKEGFEESIYCKYCGEKIDADSIYCSKCGKKQ